MPWKQLTVATQGPLPEGVAEELLEMGAISVTLEGDGKEVLVERYHGDTPLWQEGRLTALFPVETREAEVAQALSARGASLELAWSRLEDQDWGRAWMDRFGPIQVGARLWICPTWIEPPEPGAVNLRLDPGMAFGTGTHHTTALCLEWLEAGELAGCDVVDYGCGSGILAIAALLLGCREAWAVDTDPRALDAARVNGAYNGIGSDRLHVIAPGEVPPVGADIVIANILAEPLIELAPTLMGLTRRGGTILLAGVLVRQQEEVRSAYHSEVQFGEVRIREDWVLLVGRKR